MSSSSEHMPLLRSTPRAKSHFAQRMFAYTIVGLTFLGLFQLIFLARTSARRDWNHLHNSKFTTQELEREIVKSISNESIAAWTEKYYLSKPHVAGENRALAEYTRDQFESFGFRSWIEEYEVLLNYPLDHSVSVVNGSSVVTRLSLEEDVLKKDPTTGLPDRVPTFFGYSPSGNATGQLVYANYGTKKDYEFLVSQGVDFTGKVVLVRYGGVFRGLKVKFAHELGAVAVLIYSEIADDGGITEENGYKQYPDGPARQLSSVQRGSVSDIPFVAGDPTTPGWASTPGAPRVPPVGLAQIPAIPISYKDAVPLLEILDGHGPVFDHFKGAADVDYAVGPSELEVNVFSEQEYELRTIYDVLGEIDGVHKDRVIVGNHRDAWIIGGADPNSGTATLLAVGKALGELVSAGWKPYRSIALASWDAEEYGLVGSTEWGEDHASFLKDHTVTYLNVDVAYSGPQFGTSASPLLHKAILDAGRLTPSPKNPRHTLIDYWETGPGGVRIGALGSGSDYTVFQDHLGIPSLDAGFDSNRSSNVYHYHSNYDSYHWQTTFGDTDFSHHTSLAQFLGLVVGKLTDHAVLPLRTSDYATLLHKTLNEYLGHRRDDLSRELLSEAQEFVSRSASYDAYLDDLQKKYEDDYPWYLGLRKFLLLFKIKLANLKLLYFERNFLYEDGLDGRPWFKHIVFAPGRYTGYAGQILPGIAEALEDNEEELLYKWIEITRSKIHDVNNIIE